MNENLSIIGRLHYRLNMVLLGFLRCECQNNIQINDVIVNKSVNNIFICQINVNNNQLFVLIMYNTTLFSVICGVTIIFYQSVHILGCTQRV